MENFATGRVGEEDVDGFLAEISAGRPASRRNQPPPRGALPRWPAGVQARMSLRRRSKSGASRSDCWYRPPAVRPICGLCLIRSRLAGKATILNEDPPPEVLKGSSGRFAYTLDPGHERWTKPAVRECLNVDQVEITSFAELHRRPGVAQGTIQAAGGETRAEEVVRVSVERLDPLLNLVGRAGDPELRLPGHRRRAARGATAEALRSRALEEKNEELAKITHDLQDGIMKVRMLPVNNVFNRFHRVVRDLAEDRRQGNHPGSLRRGDGDRQEGDRPHRGPPGAPRAQCGRPRPRKPRASARPPASPPRAWSAWAPTRTGTTSASRSPTTGGAWTGRRCCAKALEKGLRAAGGGWPAVRRADPVHASSSPASAPPAQVTEVSGRGVGMDVVKRAVEALGGGVRVRSARARGTTVTISLPLTMAIISALLVEARGLHPGDPSFLGQGSPQGRCLPAEVRGPAPGDPAARAGAVARRPARSPGPVRLHGKTRRPGGRW